MDILNRRANPPILIRCRPSKSTQKYGSIVYIDPEDGQRFRQADLTSEEKGKILQYSLETSNDVQRVHVHLPLRIMCKGLSKLLRGLRSFRAEDPTVFSYRTPPAQRARVSACLQDFSLSKQDWISLKIRIESSTKWIVESYNLDVDFLVKSIDELKEDIQIKLESIRTLRSKFSPEYEDEFTEEDFNEALLELQTTQDFISKVKDNKIKLLSKINKAHLLPIPDKTKLLRSFESLEKFITSLDQLDLARYEREALHKFRLSVGEEQAPTHIRPLSEELSVLKSYFPALNLLEVRGDSLVLSIAGVDIVFSEESISIRGDLANLAKFSEKTISVSKKGGRNRFRAILREDGE